MVESICIQDVSGWGVVSLGYRIAGHDGILALFAINKERKRGGRRERGKEGRRRKELTAYRLSSKRNPNPSALSDITGHRLRLGIDACFSMIEPNVMRRLLDIRSQAPDTLTN